MDASEAPGMPEATAALLRSRIHPDLAPALAEIVLTAATPAVLMAAFADTADSLTEQGYPDIAWVLDEMSYSIRERTET